MCLRPIALVVLWASLLAGTAGGEEIRFDADRWTWQAQEWRVEEHLGRQSLYLLNGQAWIDGLRLEDGEVEFDVAFTPERGFVGGVFRHQDAGNYEHFYLRPHQSANDDANQYTPVFDGSSAWQLYHGPSYATPIEYPFDQWIHIRIVFAGGQADIYVDSDEPVLSVDLRRSSAAGSVGLSANLAEAHFSRFAYREASRTDLRGQPVPEPAPPAGSVMEWRVSSPFAEAGLSDVTELSAAELNALSWSKLAAGATGITNLARPGRDSREANTVLAETTIRATTTRVQRVQFGYSDRVRVYANGRLVYAGDNGYRSRDYRFLGTIGLFDEVYVSLRPGENQLVFAVSEDFGGWGLQAVIPARAAISPDR